MFNVLTTLAVPSMKLLENMLAMTSHLEDSRTRWDFNRPSSNLNSTSVQNRT